jgi:drug/metabolite transporter (DMT)-like permease
MNQHTAEEFRRGYGYAAIVVCVWSGFIIVSRFGGTSNLTAYDVIALRYAVAGLVMIPLWLYHRTTLWDLRKLVLSLVGALGFTLLAFNGFRHSPASHAGILLQGSLPFTVAVIAYFMTGERPGIQRMRGLTLIALGVLMMTIESLGQGGLTMLGDSLLVGASLCWAVYTVLLRHWNMPPMESTIAMTIITAIVYLPIYAVFLPKNLAQTPWEQCLFIALYQGVIVAVIQMTLYTKSVAILGATRMALFASIAPVLAALGAWALLDEPIAALIGIGLAFVSIGAWVGNR